MKYYSLDYMIMRNKTLPPKKIRDRVAECVYTKYDGVFAWIKYKGFAALMKIDDCNALYLFYFTNHRAKVPDLTDWVRRVLHLHYGVRAEPIHLLCAQAGIRDNIPFFNEIIGILYPYLEEVYT